MSRGSEIRPFNQTKHRDRFVLKGAMLLTSWYADPLIGPSLNQF
jgi:hypothetical protein